MARKTKDVDPEEELTEAFQVFDKDFTGLIESKTLRQIVKSLGEQFNEEETDIMIKEADPANTGYVRYSDFIRLITTSYIN